MQMRKLCKHYKAVTILDWPKTHVPLLCCIFNSCHGGLQSSRWLLRSLPQGKPGLHFQAFSPSLHFQVLSPRLVSSLGVSHPDPCWLWIFSQSGSYLVNKSDLCHWVPFLFFHLFISVFTFLQAPSLLIYAGVCILWLKLLMNLETKC